METIILSNISKSYNSKPALNNVSFSINEGDIVGYLGPNGSGKTTTIQAMCGLTRYDSGQLSILGFDMQHQYEKLYGLIGVVFDHNGLYERLTGRQNIELYLEACNSHPTIAQIDEVTELLDLSRFYNNKVKTYSKGMKRRLSLARALLLAAKVLLLDEPFDGIDIEIRADIIPMIKRIAKNNNTSIFLTSHIMADIEELAERMIIIKEGKVLSDTTVADLKESSNGNLTDAYLSVIKNG